MIKSILAALVLASCVHSRPTFPTETEYERQAKQQYREGKITWSQYHELLKHEKESEGTP